MQRTFSHRRSTAAAALATALALAACGGDTSPDGPDRAPQTVDASSSARAEDTIVLLVVLDALHAEHLTHLGYERETTPNLDRLARDGISFSQAFSPAPYTRAGIPSLLTGRLPDHHGVTSGNAILAAAETTLAELFAERGSITRASVANLNGSELYALDQGFEEFVNQMYPDDGRSADIEVGGQWFHQPRAFEYTVRMKEWLDADEGAPAFYYLHYLEPHSPYDPPEEFRNLWFDPSYDGVFASGETKYLVAANKGTVEANEVDHAAAKDLYDGTLAYVDAMFGDVLDDLRARDVYDRALIVVTSDHGEAFWQHGRFGHNDQLYDPMVHVPLIVKLPKGRGPVNVIDDTLVSTMDVLPSLVEWCGLGAPNLPVDGLSLEPLIAPGARTFPEDRRLILRTNDEVPDLALRTAKDKTIVVRGPKRAVLRLEHYDLVDDPHEQKNLVPDIGTLPNRRSALLRRWQLEAVERQVPRESAELTQSQMLLLERLGYKAE